MMKFSVQTLSALITAVAILCMLAKAPVMLLILYFALQAIIILLAVRASRHERKVEVKQSPIVFFANRCLIFVAIGLLAGFLIWKASPETFARLKRFLNGDPRAHVVHLTIDGNRELFAEYKDSARSVSDAEGYVGEIHSVREIEWSGRYQIELEVSTDRAAYNSIYGRDYSLSLDETGEISVSFAEDGLKDRADGP